MTDSRISAHTVGRFPSGAGNAQLAIENDPSAHNPDAVYLLLFGPENTSVHTDVGEVMIGGSKPFNVPGGVVTFSGSSVASLPKPATSDIPKFKELFAFDTNGQPTSISVQYNWLTNQLRANKACFASFSYTAYQTTARELIYRTAQQVLATSQAGLNGVSFTFGVIAAFAPPDAMLVYQVQPPNFGQGEPEVELYRIFSYKIATPDGEFEMPPGFPTSGDYPGGLPPLNLDTYLRTERVHEVGKMDRAGRGWVDVYSHTNLEPYVGALSYKPTKFLREASLAEDKFEKQFILKAKNFIRASGYGKV